jgi:hypothetical protein
MRLYKVEKGLSQELESDQFTPDYTAGQIRFALAMIRGDGEIYSNHSSGNPVSVVKQHSQRISTDIVEASGFSQKENRHCRNVRFPQLAVL